MKKMAIRMVTAMQSRQRWNDEGAVSAEYGVLQRVAPSPHQLLTRGGLKFLHHASNAALFSISLRPEKKVLLRSS